MNWTGATTTQWNRSLPSIKARADATAERRGNPDAAQQQLPPFGSIEHSPHPSVLEMSRDHQVGPVSDGDWFDGEWVRDDVAYAISTKNGECVAPGSKGTMAAPFYPGTYHIDSATQARIRPTVCLSRSRLRRAWCV